MMKWKGLTASIMVAISFILMIVGTALPSWTTIQLSYEPTESDQMVENLECTLGNGIWQRLCKVSGNCMWNPTGIDYLTPDTTTRDPRDVVDLAPCNYYENDPDYSDYWSTCKYIIAFAPEGGGNGGISRQNDRNQICSRVKGARATSLMYIILSPILFLLTWGLATGNSNESRARLAFWLTLIMSLLGSVCFGLFVGDNRNNSLFPLDPNNRQDFQVPYAASPTSTIDLKAVWNDPTGGGGLILVGISWNIMFWVVFPLIFFAKTFDTK